MVETIKKYLKIKQMILLWKWRDTIHVDNPTSTHTHTCIHVCVHVWCHRFGGFDSSASIIDSTTFIRQKLYRIKEDPKRIRDGILMRFKRKLRKGRRRWWRRRKREGWYKDNGGMHQQKIKYATIHYDASNLGIYECLNF